MFQGCSSLTSLNLSNFNTDKLKSMIRIFYDCSNLKFLDISSFKDDNLPESIEVFNDLPNFSELKIKEVLYNKIKQQMPNSWDISIIE